MTGQVINTNIMSLNAQRNLSTSNSALATSLQRLSSGLRINCAKDDAAGMAISECFTTQIRGLNQAVRNSNDGISLAQTAEGALGKLSEMMQRMRELAVQSANATNGASDRASLNAEYQELGAEIGRTISTTQFNGLAILSTGAGPQAFQVGANSGETVTVTTTNMAGDATLTAVTGGGLTTVAASTQALTDLDAALDTVNGERALYGAAQNRFEAVIATLQVSAENQAAARSRIMDADFAAETAALSRAQILQQAGNAMVAQANPLPQQVLSLLQR